MPGVMDGVRVVDVSIALSGPWAASMLADQGASVIKIETPGIGDIGRWIGPAIGGVSAMAQMVNRGKRSIALNLTADRGREIALRLVKDADVFIQNFRPGVMERLGLGYEDLKRERPDLVYLSISGFGSSGPYAGKSAYDPVVQAYAGLASVQSSPASPDPQLIRHTAADKITGLTACQAVSAALFARERGAGGQHIELSMLESIASFVWADAAGKEILLDYDGPMPSSFARDQKLWPTLDGWVIAAPVSDADVAGICRGVGVEGYDAPEVSTIMARRQNPEAFADLLARVLENVSKLTTEEAIRGMEREKAPCGVVVSPSEFHRDPQVDFLGMLEDSEHPSAGRLRQPRPPARFSETPSKTGPPAPTTGQHSNEILNEIGLANQIESLRADGVVA
jgi:crotonobetainyl-CoA:carnitine CoA-transferase CaiB-like acyl-CoA transferase